MNIFSSNNDLLNILIGRVSNLNNMGLMLMENLTLNSFSIEKEFDLFMDKFNYQKIGNRIIDENNDVLFFTKNEVLYIDYTYIASEFVYKHGLPLDLTLMVCKMWYNKTMKANYTIYQIFYNEI